MGATEEEAFAKREEYKQQERTQAAIRANPTVKEYVDSWLPLTKAGIRENTHELHTIHAKHLCKVIGDLFVADVRPLDIKKVYSEEYGDKSHDYISHAKSVFVAIFESAVEDGLLRTNPAKTKTAKPHSGIHGSHRAITAEERALIESTTDHRMYAPAMIMLYAGLRPQEVKSLKIDRDVDFKAGVIHVREFVHMDGHNHYVTDDQGKTEKAIRDVPLFLPVREALQGVKGYLLSNGENVATRAAWSRGWRAYKNLIENKINGMKHALYGRLIKNHELPPWRTFDVTPYDLRHSFATWCRDNGVELHTCIEWMGHTDAQMILRIYDEVTDSRTKKEAERLEKMLLSMRNGMQTNDDPAQSLIDKGIADEG